jgi:putative transposase
MAVGWTLRRGLAGRRCGWPRGDKRKGFTGTDCARFLDAAHQQPGGPLLVVWDGLSTQVSRAMCELAAARDWLTVCQLRPYASELTRWSQSGRTCPRRDKLHRDAWMLWRRHHQYRTQ